MAAVHGVTLPKLPRQQSEEIGQKYRRIVIRKIMVYPTFFVTTILVKSIWYSLKICYVFIIARCSMMKAALFPKLGPPSSSSPPPPIQCCFKGDTLSTLTQHCMGGGGRGEGGGWLVGGGGGGRGGGRLLNGAMVKKGQVYHDF